MPREFLNELKSIDVIVFVSGYGNLAPKTGPGKVVTIIYALIGETIFTLTSAG